MSMYADVIMTIGISLVDASVLSRRQTSAPSIFGRSLSSRITSGGSCLTRASALAPSRAICTTCPRPDSTFKISRTTSGSSSITSTRAMSVSVDHRTQAGLGDVRLPVALVDEVRADVALAIDQRRLGHRADAPRLRDLADVAVALGLVEVDVKRQAVRQRLVVRGERVRKRDVVAARDLRAAHQPVDQRDQHVAPGVIGRQRDDREVVAGQ